MAVRGERLDKMSTQCAACPFQGATVGCSGDINAEFVIVTEAPGIQELRTGEHFSGPAGQILSQTLKRHMPNTPVFVTSALACRPPGGREVPKSAIEACHFRLKQQLSAAPRKVILAFGNTALRSLTQN